MPVEERVHGEWTSGIENKWDVRVIADESEEIVKLFDKEYFFVRVKKRNGTETIEKVKVWRHKGEEPNLYFNIYGEANCRAVLVE